MKIAFGMIVFEGDYVLQQCLEQVYPFAEQILIAEGPVSYWQRQGRTTSLDDTNKILDEFPDPDNKIKIVHGQFSEKDDQCKSYMDNINLIDARYSNGLAVSWKSSEKDLAFMTNYKNQRELRL